MFDLLIVLFKLAAQIAGQAIAQAAVQAASVNVSTPVLSVNGLHLSGIGGGFIFQSDQVNPKVPPRMVEEFRLNLSADTELALTYENFSNKLEQHFRLLWRQKNTASIESKTDTRFPKCDSF